MLRRHEKTGTYPWQAEEEGKCRDNDWEEGQTNTTQVWINQGDIILLSLRDYQDEKGDVVSIRRMHVEITG